MELNYKILKSDSYINVKHVLKEYFNVSDRLLLKLKNKLKYVKMRQISADGLKILRKKCNIIINTIFGGFSGNG